MSVTIISKDVGDVKDKNTPQHEYIRGLEDFNEDYIKRELEVEDE